MKNKEFIKFMSRAVCHHFNMILKNSERTKESISASRFYDSSAKINRVISPHPYDTEMYVETITTVDAILKYDNPVALNFASFLIPGGHYLTGSFSQEESLCHHSNLYEILSSFDNWYFLNKNMYMNNNLYTNRAIVTPGVLFDGRKEAEIISIAAPNINGANLMDAHEFKKASDIFKDRIDFVLEIASYCDPEVLILGAFGCGDFGNDPYVCAKRFKELLDTKYKNVFKKVVFAIPKAGSKNHNAFCEYFKLKLKR